MTMTIPNNSSAKRITVQIRTASGDAIEAWVYMPEGSGPHPALVIAHGIGGIMFRSAGGHYDVYEGGAGFADVLRAEVDFLHRHAKTAARKVS